ncbi:MAG: DUF2326 domain-containing protein [Dolichospermum sp.]
MLPYPYIYVFHMYFPYTYIYKYMYLSHTYVFYIYIYMRFQYICTLNSDRVPRSDFALDFDFDSFVRLRLTDEGEEGKLLGISF